MGNSIIRGKDLSKLGYTSNTSRSIAINIVNKHFKYSTKNEVLVLLEELLKAPEKFMDHEVLAPLAFKFVHAENIQVIKEVKLLDQPNDFKVFGAKQIQRSTVDQMEKAMLLPISVKGALMPDAHQGYGLPIGGVLAARNAVIPYGVGLDIGCRMSLSIFDADEKFIKRYGYQIKNAIKNHTHFGIKNDVPFTHDHEILERIEFKELSLPKNLHGKAARQLGTSGSGNHFVEVGVVELPENNALGLEQGNYVGLLTHSGSRGFGAEIAKYFTQVAIQSLAMPKGMQHLAWLDLNSVEGKEYWILMNLAGDYAKACHDVIHKVLGKELGLKKLVNIENHHNFAWKEEVDGKELIVHRKGATPAANGLLGIIPGSMTAPGYIVRGLGNEQSLNSASHGAGRTLTRSKAKASITMSELRKHLKQQKVTLIGGGVDESPFVYKNIERVMKAQHDLVEVLGTFKPSIVRMDKK